MNPVKDIAESIEALVVANRILANEGVLDAFGHVSVRHPERPDHFLLSTSSAPELVCAQGIVEHGSDSEPVQPTDAGLYAERYIHGEIYRLRPDVHAICHHHSPAVLPFCIGDAPRLVPVYQHGAMIGADVPVWDSRTDFGDTNLLITNAAQGASLARALGSASVVLMRHHGATVVGKDIKELVFRSVTSCRNAEFLYRALAFGPVHGLTPGEIQKASKVPDVAMARAWRLWAGKVDA
jgi:ribulose-5-phosphate 4-epimerase/fuculose-1-phosphate aldolase